MCGAFGVSKNNPQLREFNRLFTDQAMLSEGWQNCGKTIEIIHAKTSTPTLEKAIWWLLLEQDTNGKFKPHSKYTTFNSRWHEDTGFSRASAQPFKTSRCIIPADSFIESQNKQYWHLQAKQKLIAFGGLYKSWQTNAGEILSCSMITLPPHPRMQAIHKKAMPLMLPTSNLKLLNDWLNPTIENTEIFSEVLKPRLQQDFTVQQLAQWGSFTPKADTEPYLLSKDV